MGAVFGFDEEVGLVADQLCIEAEDGAESAFDLLGCVVASLQAADGGFDECVQGGDVDMLCGADVPGCVGCGHRDYRLFDGEDGIDGGFFADGLGANLEGRE